MEQGPFPAPFGRYRPRRRSRSRLDGRFGTSSKGESKKKACSEWHLLPGSWGLQPPEQRGDRARSDAPVFKEVGDSSVAVSRSTGWSVGDGGTTALKRALSRTVTVALGQSFDGSWHFGLVASLGVALSWWGTGLGVAGVVHGKIC